MIVDTSVTTAQETSPPKVIWEQPSRRPSWQRMDSPTACASKAMPTADKSNHSAERKHYKLFMHKSNTFLSYE